MRAAWFFANLNKEQQRVSIASLQRFHLPLLLALLLTGVIVACGGAEEATEEPAAQATTAAPTAAAQATGDQATEPATAPTPTVDAAARGSTAVPTAAAVPTQLPAGTESVGKLTVAADGWGSDLVNTWEDTQPSFIRDYFVPRLLTRDENMTVQPLLATSWEQDEDGIRLTLHPNATCENGERLDAQAVATNLQAFLGNIEGFTGSFLASTLDGLVDDQAIEVVSDTELYIGTDSASPAGWSVLHGANYHLFWFHPPEYLIEVGS